MVAQRVRQGKGAPAYYSFHTDHLGNVAALCSITGVLDAASLARYDPFGNSPPAGDQPRHD